MSLAFRFRVLGLSIALGMLTVQTVLATNYSAAVLASNPVAYWRLGESSGTTVNNQVGTQNGVYDGSNFTLGVAGIPGAGGDTAVNFTNTSSSTDGRFNVPHNASFNFNIGDDFTVETWFKVSTTTGNTTTNLGPLFSKYDAGGFTGYLIGVDRDAANSATPNQLRLHAQIQSNGSNFGVLITDNSIPSLDNGQWHQAVLVHNSAVGSGKTAASISIYVDGQLASTSGPGGLTLTGGSGASTLLSSPLPPIMNQYSNAWFAGVQDEVSLYHSVLSPTTILAHYNAGITAAAIPEPSGIALLVSGMIGFVAYTRRKNHA